MTSSIHGLFNQKIVGKVIDKGGRHKYLVKIPIIDDDGLPSTPTVIYVYNKIAVRISTIPLTYELQGMAFIVEEV